MKLLLYFTIGATTAGWLWEVYRSYKWRRMYLDQVRATEQIESAFSVYRDNAVVMKWRGKVLSWPDDVEPTAVFDRLVWLADQDVESDS